ncbi:MAG: methyltransferase domain-containing protein [Candidatus Acetothermia bacterium]|jgi:SAM-dependent methyltransferase|nr:methyltransferase domain-containing protein [Candidatus Acetothermia bacterium]MDH7504930.1 methyltransferase domain-containing protein [Candidatus Acetothermia bacterium]
MDLKCDYGKIAPSYDRYRDLSPELLEGWLGVLIRWGRPSPGMKALDIGCGTGRLTIPLQRLTGAEVWGLDLSEEMLEQARQKKGAAGVHWVLGDAQALPFPEGAFDFAFMCLVLHHLGDKAQAIREMHRVLRPGGRGLVWTVSHRQIRESPLNAFFPSLAEIDLARFPSIREIRALMEGAGFSAIREEELAFQEETPTSCYLERVRNRYISTLELLSPAEFASGLAKLEKSLANKRDQMTRTQQFTIIVGER